MKKPTILFFTSFLGIAMAIVSCKKQQEKAQEDDKVVNSEVVTENTAPVTLEKLDNSPAYTDASLEMNIPRTNSIAVSGEVNFDFTVNNYELGAQTQSVNATRLANSGKGQHIHFILNNEPYSAHYESAFTKAIPEGTHHLVAFLSRSYHESVKNDNAVVVRKIQVGANSQESNDLDMEQPTLIYSRPKGEYSGTATENILLDFFVLNTELSKDGNKVKATINGEEFMITEWVPHTIKGLPLGEVIIKLALIDASGKVIPGPFNDVTRTVLLKK